MSVTPALTMEATSTDRGQPCAVCQHNLTAHDAISHRYCQATHAHAHALPAATRSGAVGSRTGWRSVRRRGHRRTSRLIDPSRHLQGAPQRSQHTSEEQ